MLRFFEMRLLGHLGYQPQMEECVVCGASLEPVTNGWSAEAGGVLCPACARNAPMSRPLSVNALKMMRLLQKGRFRGGGPREDGAGAGGGAGAPPAGVPPLRARARRPLGALPGNAPPHGRNSKAILRAEALFERPLRERWPPARVATWREQDERESAALLALVLADLLWLPVLAAHPRTKKRGNLVPLRRLNQPYLQPLQRPLKKIGTALFRQLLRDYEHVKGVTIDGKMYYMDSSGRGVD